jgi:hydroxymethylglutaryl-CoA reductase
MEWLNWIVLVASQPETMSIVTLGLWNIWVASKSSSKEKLLQIAMRVVRDVAASQLSSVEKRQRVVESLRDKAPSLTRFFNDDQLHEIAERAYQLLKAELKQ